MSKMDKDIQPMRYSDNELLEFEGIIDEKLEKSRTELNHLLESIKSKSSSGGVYQMVDDNADSMEKEYLNKMATRMQKFIKQLENAKIRIKNGTYGLCVVTKTLIPKERLKIVPHTQHSIEAKKNRI